MKGRGKIASSLASSCLEISGGACQIATPPASFLWELPDMMSAKFLDFWTLSPCPHLDPVYTVKIHATSLTKTPSPHRFGHHIWKFPFRNN